MVIRSYTRLLKKKAQSFGQETSTKTNETTLLLCMFVKKKLSFLSNRKKTYTKNSWEVVFGSVIGAPLNGDPFLDEWAVDLYDSSEKWLLVIDCWLLILICDHHGDDDRMNVSHLLIWWLDMVMNYPSKVGADQSCWCHSHSIKDPWTPWIGVWWFFELLKCLEKARVDNIPTFGP